MVEKLKLKRYVEFNFGEDYMVYKGSHAFLVKLIQFAVPYVNYIEFNCFSDEWYNVVFDLLSRESKQKTLTIDGLPVVIDIAKTALTNMVDRGVLIEFRNLELLVVFQLPPCNFECLAVESESDSEPFMRPRLEWRFLKYIKCSFRKLNFSIAEFSHIDDDFPPSWKVPGNFLVDYIQEIHSTKIVYYECTLELFMALKRVFPNANTLTIDLFFVRQIFENYIVEIKEAICQAPQEYIHILSRTDALQNERRLIEFFDGKKIDENTFEWKMESNEKKTFKLQIPGRKNWFLQRYIR
uniref:DUF38 domain-containing protein n=1 Tax=Panagrolaimus sp. JU765 TaxID=591449 RepID=A0AC34QDT7_9BILA